MIFWQKKETTKLKTKPNKIENKTKQNGKQNRPKLKTKQKETKQKRRKVSPSECDLFLVLEDDVEVSFGQRVRFLPRPLDPDVAIVLEGQGQSGL